MNYDDLLWKCQSVLDSRDYMRLAGLVVAEKELRHTVKELRERITNGGNGKYSDVISDGGMDPRN